MHNRKCPKCENIITHKNKYARNQAEKKNKLCKECSKLLRYGNTKAQTRKCPKCKNIISYSNRKNILKAQRKKLYAGTAL